MALITSHPRLALGLVLLGMFVLLNILALRQAWAMTHFLSEGSGKRLPEDLTRLQKLWALVGGMRLCRPQSDDRPDAFGLAFETHTVPGAAGDLEAWYVPHPHPVGMVLLFHGYNSCKARLLAEARGFHELAYSCFLVDFPGHGGSAGVVTTIGYREALDVAAAANYVRRFCSDLPLTLFGQSMGAVASLKALADGTVAAEAAILESPFDRLINTVKTRFATMGLPAFPAAHLMVFWGGVLHGYNGFAHNPAEYARRVRCPVLLMYGRDDRRVRYAEVEAVYRALPGEKQMHVFEGLGHESYAAARPEEWKSLVAAFLQSQALTSLKDTGS
jgi:alpha-beta hydrolase superfamily lysophospholipase